MWVAERAAWTAEKTAQLWAAWSACWRAGCSAVWKELQSVAGREHLWAAQWEPWTAGRKVAMLAALRAAQKVEKTGAWWVAH